MITDRYVSSTGTSPYFASTNPTTPCSLSTAGSNATSGDRFNIIADGIYARGTTIDTFPSHTSPNSPVIWRGYLSTPGDGYQSRTNGNGPLITSHMPVITYAGVGRINVTSGNQVFDCLYISGANVINTMQLSAGNSNNNNVVQNCVVIDSVTTAISETPLVYNCDLFCTSAGTSTSIGVFINGNYNKVINTRINMSSGTGSVGITAVNSSQTVLIGNQIIGGSAGIGMQINNISGLVCGNTILNLQDGINISGNPSAGVIIINNLITDCSGWGINTNSNGNGVFLSFNAFRNNTAGNVNASPDWITGSVYGIVSNVSSVSDYIGFPLDVRLAPTSPAIGAAIFSPASIGAIQNTTATGGSSAKEVSFSFI